MVDDENILIKVCPCAQSDGQADFSFEDLLAFLTGADHLPPLGFPRLISLRFYSQVGIYHISTGPGDVKMS